MTTTRRIALCVLGLVATLLVSGCASGGGGGSATSVELYEMGRHREAYQQAVREQRGAEGLAKERSALTAGLSAHALGQEAEARAWLRPLLRSRDPRIVGRAEATLGLIALSDARFDDAARLLSGAARRLEGEASARANYHAAEAYALGGHPDTARLHMRLALATTIDEGLKSTIRQRLGEFAYTVQLGAFSTYANALSSADDASSSLARLGLGDARIVEHRGASGRTLYLVQAGRFATVEEATRASVRLGRSSVVTSIDR